MLPSLCEGGFAERGENVLVFGLPGRGKTHLVAAVGHELVQRGVSVLFVAAFALVQRLLAARRSLSLEKALHDLDGYDVVIIDDIGYFHLVAVLLDVPDVIDDNDVVAVEVVQRLLQRE